MAGSVNKVILIGNLGKDPEARSFSNGGKVVNLTVATSETWKDKNGERQERTEWHRVSILNEKLGEVAERYLRKGSKVYLEGKLETRKYQAQDGSDRYSTEIVLRNFDGELTLLDSKGSGEGAGGSYEDQQQSRPAQGQQSSASYTPKARISGEYVEPPRGGGGARKPLSIDDDIPFQKPWQ